MAALDEMDLDSVSSQGYCFQVDLAWRAHRLGLRVVEVPITFVERELARAR
jgi:dolichol-phosphate mannosyltransferase